VYPGDELEFGKKEKGYNKLGEDFQKKGNIE
jgi:hypothetical protein